MIWGVYSEPLSDQHAESGAESCAWQRPRARQAVSDGSNRSCSPDSRAWWSGGNKPFPTDTRGQGGGNSTTELSIRCAISRAARELRVARAADQGQFLAGGEQKARLRAMKLLASVLGHRRTAPATTPVFWTHFLGGRLDINDERILLPAASVHRCGASRAQMRGCGAGLL